MIIALWIWGIATAINYIFFAATNLDETISKKGSLLGLFCRCGLGSIVLFPIAPFFLPIVFLAGTFKAFSDLKKERDESKINKKRR